jgi:hypothetical protein
MGTYCPFLSRTCREDCRFWQDATCLLYEAAQSLSNQEGAPAPAPKRRRGRPRKESTHVNEAGAATALHRPARPRSAKATAASATEAGPGI